MEWWDTTFYRCYSVSPGFSISLSSTTKRMRGYLELNVLIILCFLIRISKNHRPLLQFPFVYHIPSSAYNSATKTGSYPIQLQLSSGFSYVLYMNDATGSGTGGSTPLIQVQGYQDSGCLAKQSLAKNQTSARFTYETENDNVVQCTQSLGISWDASNGTAP